MSSFWKAKLAAWIHDPAEKALVLLRDPGVGHEAGSVAGLRSQLEIPHSLMDERADWLAAGADRPGWPGDASRQHWTRVNFGKEPVLVHPLSGQQISLRTLSEIEAPEVRNASFEHFKNLIEYSPDGSIDYRLTHLAFWRFGAEASLADNQAVRNLGALWNLLPADTRIPDGSIWEHLNLVSALAGALYDDTPALLTVSIGPVQTFLAQARSTSDLWAGSHILSSIVWEGLRIFCEDLGPDSILFPNLLGISLVDDWLLHELPEGERRKRWRDWLKAVQPDLFRETDESSLFVAALPNKFVAIVPRRQAEGLVRKAADKMQKAASDWAAQAAEALFPVPFGSAMRAQIDQQIADFPEVHWSISPWPVPARGKGNRLNEEQIKSLRKAEATFLPNGSRRGFFSEDIWAIRDDIIEASGVQWHQPGPGSLYPLVYRIADKTHAAAKQLRPFCQLPQAGYRCTSCGEREWLRGDNDPVDLPPGGGRENHGTVWSEFDGRGGVKDGERLCALCTMKRIWPRIFSKRVSPLLNSEPSRYVVSTYAMSLATGIDNAARNFDSGLRQQLSGYRKSLPPEERYAAALPRRVVASLRTLPEEDRNLLRSVPTILDWLKDENQAEKAEQLIASLGGEAYYALLLMDGDRAGAWLTGQSPAPGESELRLSLKDVLHPAIRTGVTQYAPGKEVKDYLDLYRPTSPSRHAAISSALNHFATTVARNVIEMSCRGRLIYAGCDDVLAMLPVEDLLDAIGRLRSSYSGEEVAGVTMPADIHVGGGFWQARRNGQDKRISRGPLLRMMGNKATASFGAVIAHHQTPLALVLRTLHKAEQEAKLHGRNAFAIHTMKRSGGETTFVASFKSSANPEIYPLAVLSQFRQWLGSEGVSRRAVYHSLRWLRELPATDAAHWRKIVATNLAAQLRRQCSAASPSTFDKVTPIACTLVDTAFYSTPEDSRESAESLSKTLQSMLITAEFLARETRQAVHAEPEGDRA